MVRSVSARTPRAFEAFARAHHEALVGVATRLCGDAAEGRDLVQDAFERALRNFHRFDPTTDARAWLSTIVHNAFIDRCRKRARAPRTEPVEVIEATLAPAAEDDTPPPWAEVTAEELRAAIEELEPDFRDVYTLYSVEERSYEQIAATLGIQVNTVGSRLSRARRKLRATLTRRMAERAEGTR
jgi:RNA polymerase sigma-70 factor (ECF subfamily)